MNNREEKIASIIGQPYTGCITSQIDTLLSAIASRPTLEKHAFLERAFLEDDEIAKLSASDSAMRTEVEALKGENEELKKKLSAADSRADGAIASAKEAMRAENRSARR